MTRARLDSIPKHHVLGVPIHAVTMKECVALCDEAIATREPITVGVVNAAKLVKMRGDRLLRDSVLGADLIIADGMAVVWASRILGQPLPMRVTGIDLFEGLLSLADRKKLSVYLLGAAKDVLDDLVDHVRRHYPGVKIVGQRDGYFAEDEAEQVAVDIAAARADMLFVGITTPKKEMFLDAWGSTLGVSVCHGVGGAFDVMTGKTRRAPVMFQSLGLEWLWRVVQEPARMWRRYLVTNSQFIGLVATEWGRTHWRKIDGSR
jgi:N-acetylglucosaminyldiphosphoundecaprenol N-acetyl-beta-D-mannosaminyltransferase